MKTSQKYPHSFDHTAIAKEYLQLWQTLLRAFQQYTPRPYRGRVTLLRTRGQPFLCSFDSHFGWDTLAHGGVKAELIPGAHEKVFMEPSIGPLANAVRRGLEQADSEVAANAAAKYGSQNREINT